MSTQSIPKWQLFEHEFTSGSSYANPYQEAELTVTFTTPSGRTHVVDGFWDGGDRWLVRYAPGEEGTWRFETSCSDAENEGLHGQAGTFDCTAPTGDTPFNQHGPVQMAANKRHLEHVDGKPFFWLADTAWNGPLRSTDDEWTLYLQTRKQQKFTAVQWVATQWRAAPDGDINHQTAYSGTDEIELNPTFFQRMDGKAQQIAEAGMLSVPVLLWTLGSDATREINPGHSLSEEQAAKFARYMVARWQGYPSIYILPGDGNYLGERADRWKRIGQMVFSGRETAPVALHCCGVNFPFDEFQHEEWLDIIGYQSGHGDSDETLQWIVTGPPAQAWAREPRFFYMNFEPAYENHVAYQSKQPHDALSVRNAIYWSLLNAPTAGVTYGGHGVWGWDDGTAPSVDHPNSGVPLPWNEALTMEAAEQMRYLFDSFTGVEWWRLRPNPELLAQQPGKADVHRWILASSSSENDLIGAYLPRGGEIAFNGQLANGFIARWLDPRTGKAASAHPTTGANITRFTAPSQGDDWLLIIS